MCRFFYFTSLAADYIFPKARGERRLTAPGFKPSLGSRPWRLRFRPQSGLVQRGVLYAAFGSGPSCWLAPPPSPLWEACHWILSRPRAPCESSSLATPLKRWNCGYWAVASIWVYGSRGEKTIQPGFARGNAPKPGFARGNAPLLVLTHHLSPGGGTLLYSQLLNS
jgi:hypothetical protein